jgi:hypothetical protein
MPVPSEYQRATDDFYKFLEGRSARSGFYNDQSGLHHGPGGSFRFFAAALK